MNKSALRVVGLLGLVALLCVGVLAAAESKVSVRYKEVHYEFTTNIYPVGDPADGHVQGVWVRRGLTILDTGEVAAYWASGDVDITKGVGTISGHDTTTFDDGSTWSTKFEGQFSVGPKGLWVIPHKGEFTKGTGRFEGIKGTLVYTSKQINSKPDFANFAETEGTATYTLPAAKGATSG
jgi:hypothetical protein